MERDAARECYLVIGWNHRARKVVEELFMASPPVSRST
jgi:hypothetical protein